MLKTKKIVMILLSMLLVCSMVGCGDQEPAFKPLPIDVNGAKILLGQSTLQAFIDAGYKVTLDKTLKEDIAGEKMPTMTYDVAAYVSKDNKIVGMVSFLNNTKDTLPFEECIVNEYEITYKDPSWTGQYDTDNVLVDGIKCKGMMIDDVKKAFKDKVESFDEFKNPDGSIGVMSFELNGVHISVHFDYTTKEATTVETEVFLSYFE
ncbi:hypothetical protein [Inediibacterium massiliense]|uniref:hypothetical protein n=1 Tax=Inediibacterium massiliense TaxID=1658111 RepID=UPI0006B668E5|nr:hypothetical protein [Inediibacterium massiliense]